MINRCFVMLTSVNIMNNCINVLDTISVEVILYLQRLLGVWEDNLKEATPIAMLV